MASKVEEKVYRASEEEILQQWLVDRFLALGFPPSMAADLVAAKVDWREAERLLKQNPPGGTGWIFWYLMPGDVPLGWST